MFFIAGEVLESWHIRKQRKENASVQAGFSFLIQSKTLALALVLPGVRAALKSSLETAPQTHQMWCFANALGVC